MNLEEEILREHSRAQAERIARWGGGDRGRFARLMKLFLKGEYRVTQRAAWPVGICAEAHPALVQPYLGKMITRMQETGVHEAVRRNVVRILQDVEIPHRLLGRVATVCFDYLASADSSIAVQSFSMTVLSRIASAEPDLRRELRLVIEQKLPFAGAGFRACARRVLEGINRQVSK